MGEQFTVRCPTCAAEPGDQCRTRGSGRPTRTHAARYEAQYPRCVRCGCRERTHPIDTCDAFVAPQDPDFTIGYSIEEEAWYRDATRKIGGEAEVRLSIQKNVLRGSGTSWEFSIAEDLPGALRVRVYDDAWAAFSDIPEFFAGLADLGNGVTVEEVVELMDQLGYRDDTRRQRRSPA